MLNFKKILLIALLSFGCYISISAQIEKKNLIQIKSNANLFFDSPNEFNWYTPLIFPDFSFKRFLKYKKHFIELEADNLIIGYLKPLNPNDKNRVKSRYQYVFGAKTGQYFQVFPDFYLFIKGGIAYRCGLQVNAKSVYYEERLGRIVEVHNATYLYNDLGLTGSLELLFQFDQHLYFSLDISGERFFVEKYSTKEQLRAGIGIGYAF